MGKTGKNQRQKQLQRTSRRRAELLGPHEVDLDAYLIPNSNGNPLSGSEDEAKEEDHANRRGEEITARNVMSKYLLYEQSVQSPKGDMSYLLKFFLLYVGGRVPLHLQEDFCGTAFLSTEWLNSDPRRTAVALDFDIDALNWCMDKNAGKFDAHGVSRLSLFHGNVLHPFSSKLVKLGSGDSIKRINFGTESSTEGLFMNDLSLPGRDIVCAFNYSCCCLHKRRDLVMYFKYARKVLSKEGGIFVIDLYGGTSSECKMKLQKKFPGFTYIWEQDEFDVIQRKTRISLHFHVKNPNMKLSHAFSYDWRLWSLPEIRDCLEEAGFLSIHFWIRQMPDVGDVGMAEGYGIGRDVKYEEVQSFRQHDSWNAYVVAVTN